MNPDKFTHKINEAIVEAHELAMSAGHAQFTLLHLAVALISDPTGIFSQAIVNEEAQHSVTRVFNQALKKFPSQSPPTDEIPTIITLIKAILRVWVYLFFEILNLSMPKPSCASHVCT